MDNLIFSTTITIIQACLGFRKSSNSNSNNYKHKKKKKKKSRISSSSSIRWKWKVNRITTYSFKIVATAGEEVNQKI